MRTTSALLAVVATAVTLVAPPAHADDPGTQAGIHAEAGKKAFAAERYAEAIAEFRAANALTPDPKLVYAIAQAQRMSGDCAGAIASYREFLATKPAPDKKLAEYSRENIERCEQELAKNPTPAPVVEPTPAPVVVPTPAPQPLPLPVAPEPRDTAPSWTSDWMGHGLVGGGIATITVGTVLFIKGRGAANDVNAATDHERYLAARADAESALTYQRAGVGLWIMGLGLVSWGVTHYARWTSNPEETRITAVPVTGGAAIVVGGTL
jgi:hypothetical protein